ncbi:hypothetical protein MASR1M45_02560 [Candidatus Kapaibacterium sp.]
MDYQTFINISKIIERDSKTTTYKFALLRGVIDIILDNSPYINIQNNEVTIPLGLLVEKWLLYYYSILNSKVKIPQINGSSNLAFENGFQNIINYYENNGGLSFFYNDLRNKSIPNIIKSEFLNLIKKIRDTIIRMPMKYIGRSISSDYYSIFNYNLNKMNSSDSQLNTKYLIENLGFFTIPLNYFEAFKVFGSFISGKDSILFKWAEFSVLASDKNLNLTNILEEVLKNPITDRDVSTTKKILKNLINESGEIYCVWSGKKLINYDIDHIIPFSIWKNNDLWNLLPALPTINNQKKDKIPSPDLIEKQKDLILHYWGIINNYQQDRFVQEMKLSLLGFSNILNWKNESIFQLKNICYNLINTRGYEEWKL